MSTNEQPETQNTQTMQPEPTIGFLKPIPLELQQTPLFQSEIQIKPLSLVTMDYSTIGKEDTIQQTVVSVRQSIFGEGAPKLASSSNELRYPEDSKKMDEEEEEEKTGKPVSENKANHNSDAEKAKMNSELPNDYLVYDTNLIDQQNELIRQEIEKDSPLISDLLPLEMLEF
eukprot:CAMPEP_0176473768 /NCGR_PEP_ID=MMETSP0127-20121128/42522_1 /TAXON_ID=938130 /ORGANISM="Platyophrya macrostoma, Strain WH" /LENGTH=171 /DNA_ID=CAMNT_0017868865 /DNA_START=10 /DNA_END=522 /DNA_ORIENTATION=-